jgi:hypothetical protein
MHDLTQTIIDIDTKEVTSVDSYDFTCPVCNEVRRYAYNFNDNIEVFCNGVDFGTKVKLGDLVMEISSEMFFKENDQTRINPPQELIDLGLVEITDTGYALTEVGQLTLDELQNG